MQIFRVLWALALMSCIIPNATVPEAASTVEGIQLVASTPGDAEIKTVLKIPAAAVDFVRWELNLSEDSSHTFSLRLQYGVGKPNTLKFINDGEKKAFQGTYIAEKNSSAYPNRTVYRLLAPGQSFDLSILQLNDNLFQILNAQYRPMIGNGGWSYTLNRKEPVMGHRTTALPVLVPSDHILKNTGVRDTFDGRTPCQDFAVQHQWPVSSECFKLKWRIILLRDPKTLEPTTYFARKIVDNRMQEVKGTWAIQKGTSANPDALIYQLDPDQKHPISLLAVDENILLLLDKNQQPFTGNADFSYTLNRRK